ncbi:hypothetical protein [Rhizobium leguminosarum]|uniref:Uncharacterized protein n=1 Tax=Rhizobium leguminosarum TaxID=384 RepID=A0A7K3VEY6_RHILE|nr:hypothetical protein [Rhizobium leguminosarum]NEK15696.1 hypothetical protein [Rhizobium leguminosarum]
MKIKIKRKFKLETATSRRCFGNRQMERGRHHQQPNISVPGYSRKTASDRMSPSFFEWLEPQGGQASRQVDQSKSKAFQIVLKGFPNGRSKGTARQTLDPALTKSAHEERRYRTQSHASQALPAFSPFHSVKKNPGGSRGQA